MNKKIKKPSYRLTSGGEFIIQNYNFAKPLANFFPGISGEYGIPLWAFYVNRAQGIVSFGTKDKDHSILEFFPANKAWQLASRRGFRTFIKIKNGRTTVYEPFHNDFANSPFDITNSMSSDAVSLRIEEENKTLKLRIKVEYFTIPQDSYAGLARVVSIENTGTKKIDIEILDGLPQIVPFGTANLFLKKLSRTIEAWMKVDNLDKGVPFYKLGVDPTDRPEVLHIKEGNFYLGFHYENNRLKIIKPLIDPENIFGQNTDFSYPISFLSCDNFTPPKNETICSKTPCGFLYLKASLKPRETKNFYAIIGYMRSQDALNSSISRIANAEYLSRKKSENYQIISSLLSDVETCSSAPNLNLYIKQTYLDNILRGGYPVIFKTKTSNSVFYLYSRKHGDLERDYNKFQIQPTYFSQGNGNYRDINQNRRCDIWFNPEIGDENIISFMNLIQADGFNPLVVKGVSYKIVATDELKRSLSGILSQKDLESIVSHIGGRIFTPGEIVLFLQESKITPKSSYNDFINILLSHSAKIQEAEHGEGFWIDHWHYNLDLLENYRALYPEKLEKLVFDKSVFTFFDNTEIVRPRAVKYIIRNGRTQQLHSVAQDAEKKELIHKRQELPHVLRSQYGKGGIYQTTLIDKLLCIFVNKLSSIDPCGCGIEMESDKPNWYDALNGLPAMFGSSSCETIELKRLAIFIEDCVGMTERNKIDVTREIGELLLSLHRLIKEYLQDNSGEKEYRYWDKATTLKEEYRLKTKLGFSGESLEFKLMELSTIIADSIKRIDAAILKAKDKNKDIYTAYFINQVNEHKKLGGEHIFPVSFSQQKLPLFLEGQVHALRLAKDLKMAKSIYRATKSSALFDKKLRMYKVTASLKDMPQEIGRCTAFTSGWLENESIWLHMEYKYMLELIKNGLYEEFYADFKNIFIPFLDPKKYGRSVIENSSFLVSSAFPDERLHGNGYVARLSGSTIEFINIWLIMNIGAKPFFLDPKKQLNLKFTPILASWLFDKKGLYRFKFLKNITVTYHNPKRKDTFGKSAVKINQVCFKDKDGKDVTLHSDIIPSPYCEQIRSRQIKEIEIYLY